MRRSIVLILTGVFCLGASLHAAAKDVEETYPDGSKKATYKVDEEGKKVGWYDAFHENGKRKIKTYYRDGEMHGSYKEYFDNGRVKITCRYKEGKIDGPYKEKNEDGKTVVECDYEDGKLHGVYKAFDGRTVVKEQLWSRGVLLCPVSADMIEETLQTIDKTDAKGDIPSPQHAKALKRLQGYRFLVGVPYEDLELDAGMNDHAHAAAAICDKIGGLNHHPKNPGLPEAEFKKAYHGTSHSNLSMGSQYDKSVDAFMYDSDPGNISRVGHRRWCIAVGMGKAGFGAQGKFGAMMCMDNSRGNPPDWDFVAFPARGYMPISFFRFRGGGRSKGNDDYAWSVSLNPAKYQPPPKTVQVKLYALNDGKRRKRGKNDIPNLEEKGDALDLDYFNVDTQGFGHAPAIIFRPKALRKDPGDRYWVEIKGLKKKDGSEGTIEYYVEFARIGG